MKYFLPAFYLLLCICAGCATGNTTIEPSTQPGEYQLEKLGQMTTGELEDFLKDFEKDPELRVEAIRLIVERTDNHESLCPFFIASLKSPTKREKETALYYLSRWGSPVHIPAIESSAAGMDEHYCYSVKCTVNQIRERFTEGDR